MVRIGLNWGEKKNNQEECQQAHERADGEAVMVLAEFCMHVWNKQIQSAFC